jgi:hypothetical protein
MQGGQCHLILRARLPSAESERESLWRREVCYNPDFHYSAPNFYSKPLLIIFIARWRPSTLVWYSDNRPA